MHDAGPWNPGLLSKLPGKARIRATIFDPANCALQLCQIDERSVFCGIPPEDLAPLRPERLALHELLIRITGDFTVPDGKVTADLGISFRAITKRVWDRAVAPELDRICAEFERLKDELRTEIGDEIDRAMQPPRIAAPAAKPGWLARLFGRTPSEPASVPDDPDPARTMLEAWRQEYRTGKDRRRQRICRALARVVNNVQIKHGRLIGDRALLVDLALGLALNDHGSVTIGQTIRPLIMAAAEQEGLRLLPAQKEPVILNTKGASAAGKSTLRQRQHALADRLSIDWADFALISPDIWRKYLLDYDSLGDLAIYAGMLTGEEIRIIDQKLDRYMAGKASRGWMSHLLIDRFRFDSFAEDEEAGLRPKLLTRFGSTIYMFFVITPPEATVERAWYRGLEVGRFKAVDDLLYHNIEAFTGMPDLFFTWALHKDKTVFFEFLDNSVAKDASPKTIAFGSNNHMTILDLKCLIDIDRFKKINVDAKTPEGVYPSAAEMDARRNTGFIRACAAQIKRIDLRASKDGPLIVSVVDGKPKFIDSNALSLFGCNDDGIAGLEALLGPKPWPTVSDGSDRDIEGFLVDKSEKSDWITLGEDPGKSSYGHTTSNC